MKIPCSKGAECSWPACALDCNGRHPNNADIYMKQVPLFEMSKTPGMWERQDMTKEEFQKQFPSHTYGKTIIHTTSGSQLTYEKESRARPMEEQMELLNALKNPNPSGDQIKGYRKLSDGEIAAMNKCKDYGVEIGEVIKHLETIPSVDKRWLAIAKTDLQKAFMCLIRSIAKPETF